MSLYASMSKLLAEKASQEAFSGAVLMQRGAETIFSEAVGYANRPWRIFNTLETRFRIASVSKMFTAAATLQLIEAGRLGFDSRAVELLHLEETKIDPEVNVRQLLTMTSGIADWLEESEDWEANWEALLNSHPITRLRSDADYLPLFAQKGPNSPPGKLYRYSNASYILLGLLIERVTGESAPNFIAKNIFQRAGMISSGFNALDDIVRRSAEGYVPVYNSGGEISSWKKNLYAVTPAPAADGGAISTVADLLHFSLALRQGKLLSVELTRAMLTPQVQQGGDRYRGYTWMYGYGCEFLLDDNEEIIRYGHAGEEDGVSCRLYHFPRQETDVIILGNQSRCAGGLAWPIHDIILSEIT